MSAPEKRLRAEALPGGAAFLLGLGFQILGWTSDVVGFALIGVGGVWIVGVYLAQPIGNRVIDAIALRVHSRLDVNQLPTPDDRRELRQALRLIVWELDSIRTSCKTVLSRGAYPGSFVLPAHEWGQRYEWLARHPEIDDALDAAKYAYEQANILNQIVGPRLDEDLSLFDRDPIGPVIDAVNNAEEAIYEATERLDIETH